VRATVGVSNAVRFGTRFAIVPDAVVRDLRARADRDSGLHRLHCQPQLTAGDTVRLMGGAFDGLHGIFEREAGVERVVVLLNVLGHYTHVSVTVKSIRPAMAARADFGSSM
jgi:transcription antitermination factor NusG